MEVSYRMVATSCSAFGCDQAIHVSIGRWAGGVNDRGGLVIECARCNHRSWIRVPDLRHSSIVKGGGRVVATWNDDLYKSTDVLEAHGLESADELVDPMLVVPSIKTGPEPFLLDDRPIYRCLGCRKELENSAYTELARSLEAINDGLQTHYSYYLKGRHRVPETIEVSLDAECACASHRMVFYRRFSEAKPVVKDVTEFVLAGPDDPAMLTDIDGVYSRDDCIEIFRKLLLRWRARHRVVMLVVPFIGLDYVGRENDRLDLWDMVLGHTDPDRTLLVTRRATYDGFIKAAASKGIDIAALAKFGLLTPLVDELGGKGALFKQQSHAKFYAAVGPDRTEVLTGSFNLHSGKFVENLLFKTYSTRDFVCRYLIPLQVVYNPGMLNVERAVLALDVADGQIRSFAPRTDR